MVPLAVFTFSTRQNGAPRVTDAEEFVPTILRYAPESEAKSERKPGNRRRAVKVHPKVVDPADTQTACVLAEPIPRRIDFSAPKPIRFASLRFVGPGCYKSVAASCRLPLDFIGQRVRRERAASSGYRNEFTRQALA